MDAGTWGLWDRFLKLDVREVTLQFQSARIADNRSREFFRWLIDHGKMSTFPIMDVTVLRS